MKTFVHLALRKLRQPLFLASIMISLLLVACNGIKDCGECFTPPNPILLRIVDKTTGENLLKPEAYNPDSIDIFEAPPGSTPINFEIYGNDTLRTIDTRELAFLGLNSPATFYLYLNFNEVDTLVIKTREEHDRCCTWFTLQQFDINGVAAEWDNETYTYILRK